MYRSYDLKIGYSCNNNCIHCVIQDSKNKLIRSSLPVDLTDNECIDLLQKEIAKGLEAVTITGGEATIRKDLFRIIDYCQNAGVAITLQTNGRMLATSSIRELLFPIKKITFVIALHGISASVHDSITQVPGSFEETIAGMRATKKAGKQIVMKTVISKLNMTQLPEFVPFMKREDLLNINTAFPHAQGAARANFSRVVPRYSDLRPYITEMAHLASESGIHLTFETVPYCILPEYPKMASELIYHYKEVVCTPVREETYSWNIIRKEIKYKHPECRKCFFDSYCEGPWAEYVEHFGDSEFIPVMAKK